MESPSIDRARLEALTREDGAHLEISKKIASGKFLKPPVGFPAQSPIFRHFLQDSLHSRRSGPNGVLVAEPGAPQTRHGGSCAERNPAPPPEHLLKLRASGCPGSVSEREAQGPPSG